MPAAIRIFTLLFMLVFSGAHALLPKGTKTITIPGEIKEETHTARETLVRNLSEVEIYEYFSLFVIDESIYIANMNPAEIVMVSLQGKLLGRVGKPGQGPGEILRIDHISKFDGNIAILDSRRNALLVYTGDLKFIREVKMEAFHMGFLLAESKNFIFYGAGGGDYYFTSYTADLTLTDRFAEKKSSRSERVKKKLFDAVRFALYVPQENGIWASFKNRYDLRYYKDKKLSVEIKAEKGFFSVEEKNYGGRIVAICKDARAICLAQSGGKLYYFFRKSGTMYCDIFDTNSHRLLRRIRLKSDHRKISHFKKNIFYSLCMDESEENVMLFKLKL